MRRRHEKVYTAYRRLKGRLLEKSHIFPTLFLIGVGLVLMLLCLTNFNLDPRLGHPTEPLVFEGKIKERTGIWFAVYLREQNVVVSTAGRDVFSWPAHEARGKGYEDFQKFLKDKAKTILHYEVTAENLADRNSEAVLSLDQNLTYFHVKPILLALADAKISRYSFETKLVKLSSQTAPDRSRKKEAPAQHE